MVSLYHIPCARPVYRCIHEFRCLRIYKRLVYRLGKKIDKLRELEEEIANKAAVAKNDGKIIDNRLLEWQNEVKTIKTQAGELLYERPYLICFNRWPIPNPLSRIRLGRNAFFMAYTVDGLIDLGLEVRNEIAHFPPNEVLPIPCTANIEAGSRQEGYEKVAEAVVPEDVPVFYTMKIGSRQEVYKKLWDALVREDGYPVLGIYGMPGVGKTKMIEQAAIDAINRNIFDKATRACVGSEKIDLIKLQDQLADGLGCQFVSNDDVMLRASQLKNSLMNGGSTLVMLDDVWEIIPLKYIGIPFGDGSSKGCKILFTSQRQDVCLLNNCKDPIEMKTLTEDEAFLMFRSFVGNSRIESRKDNFLAEKNCKECGSLPLLIHVIGQALKVKEKVYWDDVLYELENNKFEYIDGLAPEAYSSFETSFQKLSDGPKTCLVLCSMFSNYADIDIKILSDLATGSQLLDGNENICLYIDILKSSSLVLESKYNDTVKLHDIVRDVARRMAAKDPNYAFLFIKSPSSFLAITQYTPPKRLLQLDLQGDNVRFPHDLVIPNVHTLWVLCNNHSQQNLGGFFKAFTNLKVLVIKDMRFSQHQLFIHTLEKLRVLILEDCDLHQTFFNSISENLEILYVYECNLPSTLELTKLKNLRKLELFSQTQIKMGPNTISFLSGIKELNFPGGYNFQDDAIKSISIDPVGKDKKEIESIT